jgi:hypothetical protein
MDGLSASGNREGRAPTDLPRHERMIINHLGLFHMVRKFFHQGRRSRVDVNADVHVPMRLIHPRACILYLINHHHDQRTMLYITYTTSPARANFAAAANVIRG